MANNRSLSKRRLGHTELEVTPIGLGVMQFSGGKGGFGLMFPDLTQGDMNAIIQAALEGGINWFDTAELYGFGHSELGLARALRANKQQDDDVIIATKWFPIFRTASNIPRTIDDRLRFLNGYTIDLYMVHQPWGFSSPEAEMDAMADLVEARKIHSIGVSNFNVELMRRAYTALEKRDLPLAVNQVQYSLLNRTIETNGILDAARELGMTIVAWSPLARGILSGKYHRDPSLIDQLPFIRKRMIKDRVERSTPLIKSLEEIAAKYEATEAQVALNWLVNFQGEIVVAIPGASEEHQAKESAGAMSFELSEEEITRLDILSRDFK